MGKIYDISAKITNELPKLSITQDLTVTVNNRKQTVLNVRAYASEIDRKMEKLNEEGNPAEAEMLQNEFIANSLKMLIGEKNAEEIEKLDLPFPEYQSVYQAVMTVAQGNDPNAEQTPRG